MGNCCTTTEERDVDFDINMRKPEDKVPVKVPVKEAPQFAQQQAPQKGSDFPIETVATKVEKMNDPAPLAVPKYRNIGDYTVRELRSTENNPIGGVYRYKQDGSTYYG